MCVEGIDFDLTLWRHNQQKSQSNKFKFFRFIKKKDLSYVYTKFEMILTISNI